MPVPVRTTNHCGCSGCCSCSTRSFRSARSRTRAVSRPTARPAQASPTARAHDQPDDARVGTQRARDRCLAWDAAAGADATPASSALDSSPGRARSFRRSGRPASGWTANAGAALPPAPSDFRLAEPVHAAPRGHRRRCGSAARSAAHAMCCSGMDTACRGALAAATRCMPVSPMQAQELIVELHPALVRAVDDAMRDPEAGLFTCTPALDVRSHQQGLLTTRLFQS